MSDKSESVKFVVGGAVQVKDGTYLERPADTELYKVCKQADFAYVLACRQIGKSSLMNHTERKLRREGIKTAVIDITYIGSAVDEEKWYYNLITELADRLQLKTDVDQWWDQQPSRLSPIQHFQLFLREVVLEEILEPIVVFIDEIDFTLGFDFTDVFFAAIRSIYQKRAQDEKYKRLTFVLLGTATPDELISDNKYTPFNIGRAINLHDFTKEECLLLRNGLEVVYSEQASDYFDEIYQWTQGHPYLTQKLCDGVVQTTKDGADLVDTLVCDLFLAPEARSEHNIQFVHSSILRDTYAQAMLRIYKRVIDGKSVADDEKSPAINRLKLYGLLINDHGRLKVRNNIYAQAFDATWAEEMLKSVRLGLPEKYTILQRIDQRGFITVYLAQTEDSDERATVALKVLKVSEEAQADWDIWLERLEWKARSVAQASHPNIVKILDTGFASEKTLYIVMDYVAGGSLRDKLEKGALSRKEAMDIARQIGSALTHVHTNGIYHLAINPNDILLDIRQSPSQWVLTDFGLVKFLLQDPQAKLGSKDMQTGLYIAPEKDAVTELTPTVDIYGLAVTFFEAIVGQLPENRQPGDPLPSASGVNPDIGPHFDKVLSRATSPDPTDRFNTVADFIEALEEANKTAKEVELAEKRMRAASMIDGVHSYMSERGYDPESALSMIDIALKVYPDFVPALLLQGRILFRQGKEDEALHNYQQAYAQEQNLFSVAGKEYLYILTQIADKKWQDKHFEEAVIHYETIRSLLKDQNKEDETVRDSWTSTRERLIAYHKRIAENARSEIDHKVAVSILNREIEALESLDASDVVLELQHELKELQIKYYRDKINTIQAEIDRFDTLEKSLRFNDNKTIFENYLELDKTYQELIKLNPDNRMIWVNKQQNALKARVKTNEEFAIHALGQKECDYDTALQHYQEIINLEADHPGIAKEMGIQDLDRTIANLRIKVDHQGKYEEIGYLIGKKEYAKALDLLDRNFIQPGKYDYRNVARRLWRLVYAKKNKGKEPPELEIYTLFNALSKRWETVERDRLNQVRRELEPWASTNILKTVDGLNKALKELERSVDDIDNTFAQALSHKLTNETEIRNCQEDIVTIRSRIQTQRDTLYQMGAASETAQKVDAWVQTLDEFEGLLQTDSPLEDISNFLQRIDEECETIKNDATFIKLQNLSSIEESVSQRLDQMKLRIRRRLVQMLIDDIGHRDDELSRLKQEFDIANEELIEKRVAARIASEERSRAGFHRIDKFTIPLGVVVAFIAGAIIQTRISALPFLQVAAMAALLVYLAYYVWEHYLKRHR